MTGDVLSFMPDALNYITRIVIAVLCGFTIGFERKRRSKEAGIRTHAVVALGACLMMIVSKYAFWDFDADMPDRSRIAAQIVSGVGFIGTGMIVYTKGALRGLTTAAGIWATAGVGMAIGAGGNVMMIVGISATLIIVFLHIFLHMPFKIFRSKSNHSIQVQFNACDGAVDNIKEIFNVEKIFRMRIVNGTEGRTCTALLRTSDIPSDAQWQKIMDDNAFIISMEYVEEEWN